jgi:hypothetical protein
MSKITTALELTGFALVVGGCARISITLAAVVAGSLMIIAGIAIGRTLERPAE